MTMKEWVHQMRSLQLYVMLFLSTVFLVVELLLSHMTHALTLLVDSYHMMCSLIALMGCIIAIKYGSASSNSEQEDNFSFCEVDQDILPAPQPPLEAAGIACDEETSPERRLKNTFGWARLDILLLLIGCVFLASLCFSTVVEAVQTLVHIDHHDEMHHPIPVMCVGAAGILLNGLCYLLIGGYTFRQNSFLHVTPGGDIALDHVATSDPGTDKHPAKRRAHCGPHRPWEILRDIISSLLVIVCSVVVYFTDQQVAKFVDPLFSIVSAVSLIVLTYPYMKESGQILLQTIPDSINVESLCSELQSTFPEIVNIHDLHIWQLKATNIYSTVHITFRSHKDYMRINKDITDFFLLQGITQLTLQPEFYQIINAPLYIHTLFQLDLSGKRAMPRGMDVDCCLIPCLEQACKSRHCCQEYEDDAPRVTVMGHQHCHLQVNPRESCIEHNLTPTFETACPTKASAPSDTQPRSSGSDAGSLLPGSRPQDIKASEACPFRTDGEPHEPEEDVAGTRSHSDTEDENSEERVLQSRL
uniref:Cation efflux protein transmembrane domain-containing protein n=1 Tax=Timema douglasi TaxID=61478 RepID=A0A7R8Z827_TIMDO|nr:unnamed protein product [Timema douglasi]